MSRNLISYFKMACSSFNSDKEMDSSSDNCMNCDYDKNVTPLYQAIEDKAWVRLEYFFRTNCWPGQFQDSLSPTDQAATWVTRYVEKDGVKKVRWSQLPLHAAIILGAPCEIVKQLIDCFPIAARCADDNKMLPLHLAFEVGAPDTVTTLLLETFPGALNVKGSQKRYPADCAKNEPQRQRTFVIESILKKGQQGWGKIKATEHMKEIHRIKELMSMKKQEVKSLEAMMDEMEQSKNTAKLELMKVMNNLHHIKKQSGKSAQNTIISLVGKLENLEVVAKELVVKEQKTKYKLKQTLGELENINDTVAIN